MINKIIAVQDMQDYILEHLYENITMKEISRVSFYSPWYSYRIFLELTEVTISDYIRRLKLSKSAMELRDSKVKIIDVAYKCGYETPDGYTRAFFKEFGCNPKEYANNPIPITLFIPYGVKYKDKIGGKIMENVKNVFIREVERPSRKVIIKRGVKASDYLEYCEEVGCDVWGILTSMKSMFDEPVCMWLPKHLIKENTSTYVQGVEVPLDYKGIIPDGFDVIELPASTYLMFQGEVFKEEDFCIAIDEIWNAIDKYNPEVTGYKWDNSNPRIQLEPIGTRGYIEYVPVIKICN